jgi:Ser/Thr protein kinase RdoA (MazF antagonist)
MAPTHTFQGRLVARSAFVCDALYRAGVAVPKPVRSSAGSLVEELDDVTVIAQQLVDGRLYDDEEVDADLAHRWGRALATFHAQASVVDIKAAPRRGPPPPPDLTRVTVDVHRSLADIPRSPDAYGVLHGDPEPDNVVFGSNGVTFIDLDDVHKGWFAADIAFALRAWAPPAAPPDLSQTVPAAFIAGYRQLRPMRDEYLDALKPLARA